MLHIVAGREHRTCIDGGCVIVLVTSPFLTLTEYDARIPQSARAPGHPLRQTCRTMVGTQFVLASISAPGRCQTHVKRGSDKGLQPAAQRVRPCTVR
jgi:hypothetical protein